MTSPRYPTRQEARSLLDKMRKISAGKIAGASLLALAALAPRCGGAAYNMKPYESYDMEADKRQPPAQETSGTDESTADAERKKTAD